MQKTIVHMPDSLVPVRLVSFEIQTVECLICYFFLSFQAFEILGIAILSNCILSISAYLRRLQQIYKYSPTRFSNS